MSDEQATALAGGEAIASGRADGGPGLLPGSARRRSAGERRRGRFAAAQPLPALGEEEVSDLLYGERTGMVSASPAEPPALDRGEAAGES